MRKRLIKLLKQAEKQQSLNAVCGDIDSLIDSPRGAEFIADYLIDNGVVALPCKVGDIVYQTDGIRIYELTILDILLRKNKPYYETDAVDFDDDAIGTSIFLSREDAERALKGGAD